MAAILLASACPAVPVFTASVYRNTGYTASALAAPSIPATVDFLVQAQQIGAVTDQISRYGSGLIGVPDGPTKITLSIGTGLLLNISAGHAMIGGPVEIATDTTLAVPDATARVWVWLQLTGPNLTYTTTTTPPAGESCLLGSCVTSGGVVTVLDTSGVMYLRSGIGFRQTADYGAPSDTPPAKAAGFFGVTSTGVYLWDGSMWQQQGAAGVVSDTVASGAAVVVADGQQQSIFDTVTIYGTRTIYGKARTT